ncbi:MAG: hypothetical protein JWN31_1712 [Frankiales bacterium]|nr:hypothetical protein [Frankiales bacterium]
MFRHCVVLGGLVVLLVLTPMAFGLHLQLTGLAQAAAGSALLVGCSALALNGSRPVPLSSRRAVPAVLATSAANAITPAGIGGTLLIMRVHRRSGLTTEQAAAAAALRTAFGAVTALLVTGVVASRVGFEAMPSSHTALLVALAVAGAVLLTAVAMPVTRRRALLEVVRVSAALADVLRRPRCFVSLAVGCLGVTAAQLLTLQGAVHAVGGRIAWEQLLVALMGSAAARSALPLPGGVGPIEAALVGGLTALGMTWEAAASAVAVYRTAGHWLPVLAGAISIRELRRRELV